MLSYKIDTIYFTEINEYIHSIIYYRTLTVISNYTSVKVIQELGRKSLSLIPIQQSWQYFEDVALKRQADRLALGPHIKL